MRVRDDDIKEEDEPEEWQVIEEEVWTGPEPEAGYEAAQAKNIFTRAVASVYSSLNNWLSRRFNNSFSNQEAEYALAESVVEWIVKDEIEITPFQNVLITHAAYYGPLLVVSTAKQRAGTVVDVKTEESDEEDE